MHIDNLIKKRFEELEKLLPAILSTGVKTYGGPPSYDCDVFQKWAIAALNLLQRSFGEDSVHYRQFEKSHAEAVSKGAQCILEGSLKQCIGIIQAAKDDFENGYLFKVRSLIQAEVFENTLEQARYLLQANYKDAACILAGATLELALKELCANNSLPEGTINPMNDALSRAGVYNLAMKQQITAWAALRNCAAHGQYDQYDKNQVTNLIQGVTQFIAVRF